MTGKQQKLGLIIIVALLATLSITYYDSLLNKGPLNTHMWRQTDCLSMTKHFSEGSSLIEPEMHIQYGDNYTSGKSAGEFPILYYTVGSIWKVTGESFMAYRLFYLLILIAGLLAFFRSLQLVFSSNYWSVVLTLLLFTSPVLAYYGISFLTDAPAFCFALIGLYFFVLYQKRQKIQYIYWFTLFTALAGLSKVSMLIPFVFIGFVFLLELHPRIQLLKERKLFWEKKHSFIALAGVLVLVTIWYAYASHYNSVHKFKYTFNNIYSVNSVSSEELSKVFGDMKRLTIPVFYSKPMIALLGLLFVFNLFQYKRVPLVAYLSNIIIPIGATAYFILWLPLMGIHDYYYVALVVLMPGIVIPFIWYLKSNRADWFKNKWVHVGFGLFLLFNILYCRDVMKFKSLKQSGDSIFIANEEFKSIMKWNNWHVSNHWNNLYYLRPELESLGIEKEDRVICIPDFSYNTSLFLLGRKGWTNFRTVHEQKDFEKLKRKGAKYLIVHEPTLLDEPFLQPYIQNEVKSFNNVRIYKL